MSSSGEYVEKVLTFLNVEGESVEAPKKEEKVEDKKLIDTASPDAGVDEDGKSEEDIDNDASPTASTRDVADLTMISPIPAADKNVEFSPLSLEEEVGLIAQELRQRAEVQKLYENISKLKLRMNLTKDEA